MDQRLDHGCGLNWSCKFPVLISLGPVQSQSFSSLATGLPNTNEVQHMAQHSASHSALQCNHDARQPLHSPMLCCKAVLVVLSSCGPMSCRSALLLLVSSCSPVSCHNAVLVVLSSHGPMLCHSTLHTATCCAVARCVLPLVVLSHTATLPPVVPSHTAHCHFSCCGMLQRILLNSYSLKSQTRSLQTQRMLNAQC